MRQVCTVRRIDPRLRLLLASTSLAAMMIAGGAPRALAACSINDVNNSLGPGPITNPAATDCINVQNSTVNGNVTNTPTGALTTGITIDNSTITGAVANGGVIGPGAATGILITNNATVGGGISNSGTITSNVGILVGAFNGSTTVSAFSGGINNAGTGTIAGSVEDIVVGGFANGGAIAVSGFAGGIGNSGSLTTAQVAGIFVGGTANGGGSIAISSFGGGITNTGKITAGTNNGAGIWVGGVVATGASLTISTFAGGISNSGTITSGAAGNAIMVGGRAIAGPITVSAFSGGITNSGTLSAGFNGIVVGGAAATGGSVTVSSFSGGISNRGTISGSNGAGIFVGGTAGNVGTSVTVSAFSGGISNSGTISSSAPGILVGGVASRGAAVTVSSFGGGVTNSGTISAFGGGFFGAGIFVGGLISGFSGGTVTVSTFTGGISNSGLITATGPGGAGIVVGGTPTIGTASVGSFGGGIVNSGTISAQGAGGAGIVLSGVSLFTGGIINSSGGTISARSVGIDVLNVATFMGGITNAGTISTGAVGAGIALDATQFYGNVSNSGTITGAHTGIFVCSCVTFVGGGITNTGTISAHNGILVDSSAPVNVFNSGTIVSTGTGARAIDLSGAAVGSSLTLGPRYNITGFVFGRNGDALQLGGAGSGTFNVSNVLDVIAGGSSSSLPQYQGFNIFNVVSGTWTTTGTFTGTESWNVNGGTLAGTATFAGINVNSGGTLEPGLIGTPGTFMTLTGNLAFQSGAIYLVNLNPTTASRANVAGAVTLNGAVQGILAPGSYSTKTTYDILDPTSISGKFTGFTAINAPGFGGTLTYTPTSVLLNLTANVGAGGGLNQNQQNVANAINNGFNSGGTVPASLFPVFGLTGGALGSALSQLDGEVGTGAERAAFQLTDQFLELMLDPFVNGRGYAPGTQGGGALGFAPDQQAELPPDVALAYASILTKAPPKPSFDQRWSAWGSAFGGSNTTNGDPAAGSNNVRASTFGFAGGMDYHISPYTVVGFALAGAGTNWGLANALGTGRSDALQAGAYGISWFGPAYVAGALSFSNHWFTTNRAALGAPLTANFIGQGYGARAEGGYRVVVLPVFGVTPYGAVQFQDFNTPAYSESDPTGSGLGLNVASMNATDVRTELGSRFDAPTLLYGRPLVLYGRVAWAHDFVSNPALSAAFQALPGGTFTVNGAPIPRDSALTTAGAQLFLSANWSVIAKFDGEFGNGSQTYAGSGTLRYTW